MLGTGEELQERGFSPKPVTEPRSCCPWGHVSSTQSRVSSWGLLGFSKELLGHLQEEYLENADDAVKSQVFSRRQTNEEENPELH